MLTTMMVTTFKRSNTMRHTFTGVNDDITKDVIRSEVRKLETNSKEHTVATMITHHENFELRLEQIDEDNE